MFWHVFVLSFLFFTCPGILPAILPQQQSRATPFQFSWCIRELPHSSCWTWGSGRRSLSAPRRDCTQWKTDKPFFIITLNHPEILPGEVKQMTTKSAPLRFYFECSLLLGASADEDASREAGHEVAGDAKTRCQNVSGTVLDTVFLPDTNRRRQTVYTWGTNGGRKVVSESTW